MKLNIKKIQDQLDTLVKGLSIVQYGDLFPFELKSKIVYTKPEREVWEDTDIYLMASKQNYPQYINFKVRLEDGNITEIYPSLLYKDKERSLALLKREISPYEKFDYNTHIPYFSVCYFYNPVRDPEIEEYTYWVYPNFNLHGTKGIAIQKENDKNNTTTTYYNQFNSLDEFKHSSYYKDGYLKEYIQERQPNYFILIRNSLGLLGTVVGYNPMHPKYKIHRDFFFELS